MSYLPLTNNDFQKRFGGFKKFNLLICKHLCPPTLYPMVSPSTNGLNNICKYACIRLLLHVYTCGVCGHTHMHMCALTHSYMCMHARTHRLHRELTVYWIMGKLSSRYSYTPHTCNNQVYTQSMHTNLELYNTNFISQHNTVLCHA